MGLLVPLYGRDRYHLLVLYASRALHDPEARHFRASIGHAVSADLLQWTRVADALVRSDTPAFEDLATWTGSTVRHSDGTYVLNGAAHTSGQLIDRYARMIEDYPIYSIEDGLAEDDDAGWAAMTERLGGRVQLVGDDYLVTNRALIRTAVHHQVANAALIKVNQIGTVTETLDALAVCRDAGYGAMISHRSGETDDTFIADLAVASGCGQIKTGAPARGERVAKYNRLLEIAAETPELAYGWGH